MKTCLYLLLFSFFSCIFFHPEGKCLYAGAPDIMKVYGWEPSWCFDSVAVKWGSVADMAIAQNQLVYFKMSFTAKKSDSCCTTVELKLKTSSLHQF